MKTLIAGLCAALLLGFLAEAAISTGPSSSATPTTVSATATYSGTVAGAVTSMEYFLGLTSQTDGQLRTLAPSKLYWSGVLPYQGLHIGGVFGVYIDGTGSFFGNGSGITNLAPDIATNSAAASDGWALVKTGGNLKLVPSTAGGVSSNLVTLSFTGETNVWVDGSLGNTFYLQLTNNAHLIGTNTTGGQSITISVFQDATGGRLLSYDTNTVWTAGGIFPGNTTNALSWDIISAVAHPTTSNRWAIIHTFDQLPAAR